VYFFLGDGDGSGDFFLLRMRISGGAGFLDFSSSFFICLQHF
jgi:hypothetical protein